MARHNARRVPPDTALSSVTTTSRCGHGLLVRVAAQVVHRRQTIPPSVRRARLRSRGSQDAHIVHRDRNVQVCRKNRPHVQVERTRWGILRCAIIARPRIIAQQTTLSRSSVPVLRFRRPGRPPVKRAHTVSWLLRMALIVNLARVVAIVSMAFLVQNFDAIRDAGPYRDRQIVIPCPSGTYSTGSQSSCTACPPGWACPYTDRATRHPCNLGTYSDAGQASCTVCPAGGVAASNLCVVLIHHRIVQLTLHPWSVLASRLVGDVSN